MIMVVDDDPDILETMKLVLQAKDYIMVGAFSGEEALKLYKQEPPDFIIVDLMMEEIDAGTTFVKEVKALGNQAPIYILSSVGDEMHMSVNTSEMGLAGVFQKPIDNNVLLTTLETRLKS